MRRLGLDDVKLDDIFTCGSASASYVRDDVLPSIQDPYKKGIYLVGQASMEQELREVGLKWTGGTVSCNREAFLVRHSTNCHRLMSNRD